jgi:heme/copper-type cytochrome/quinol oxidase subunit 4
LSIFTIGKITFNKLVMFSTIDVQLISFVPMQGSDEKKGNMVRSITTTPTTITPKTTTQLHYGVLTLLHPIIGTIVAVIVTMIIGFNGNLPIGLCMYLGAGICAIFSFYYM